MFCVEPVATGLEPKRRLFETLRMRRFVESATYRLPWISSPTPIPLPPLEPRTPFVAMQPSPTPEPVQLVEEPPPAITCVQPVLPSSNQMTLLVESAMYRLPLDPP